MYFDKGSHKSLNFETFECSGKNVPNSLCHFLNRKSVFLEILHHSSVSWKITALYFFRSNVISFTQKEPIKVEILRILSAYVKIHQILVIFETTNQFFLSNFALLFIVLRHKSSILFSWDFLYFQQKEPTKVQIR